MMFTRLRALSVLTLSAFALSACSKALPGLYVEVPTTDKEKAQAQRQGQQYNIIPLTMDWILAEKQRQVHAFDRPNDSKLRLVSLQEGVKGYEYQIVPSDVLQVTVWDHPELTSPAGQSAVGDQVGNGRLVNGEGYIFYPFVGSLKVSGMTATQVRTALTQKLSRTIREPQVDVRVQSHRGQRVQVTGEVRTPGPYNLDDTARGVLDALNDRGGLTEFANRRVGLLSRDGQSFPVDLDALLRHGNANANALLRHGDVLHVQDNRNEKVFLLGEFKQEKVLPLDRGYMTLTEALSAGQGLDVNGSNDSAVYVFRAGDLPATQESLKDWQPQIIAVDLSKPESLLLASHFELKPRDVVYVSTAGISRYNRVIAQILPTVSTLFQLDILFRRNQ